jgi:hypothetical protein
VGSARPVSFAPVTEPDNRPRPPGPRGRYEVWFLTMSHPDGSSGYWIRYTTRSPVAGPPERRVWFARFDAADPARTFGLNSGIGPPPPAPPLFDADTARLGAGSAEGRLVGDGHDVRWRLEWPVGEPTVRILPSVMYRGSLVPTRSETPNPDVPIRGTVEVDGETTELDGFRAHQGHVEGTRHAERWAWAQCSSYGADLALQVLSAQGRRGPFLTPYLTFAVLRLDGEWVRLRGDRKRTWGLGTWKLRLRSKDLRLEGSITAPTDALLRTRYLDPDDAERWCHHTDVASSRLALWRRSPGGWEWTAELVSAGTTHAEWCGRTPALGVERIHQEVA